MVSFSSFVLFLLPLSSILSLISPSSSPWQPVSAQVNGIDLRKATHDEAINVLRQTPQRVRLTLYRDEAPYKEEDVCDTFTIELQKRPGKGLGLSIVGKRCVGENKLRVLLKLNVTLIEGITSLCSALVDRISQGVTGLYSLQERGSWYEVSAVLYLEDQLDKK